MRLLFVLVVPFVLGRGDSCLLLYWWLLLYNCETACRLRASNSRIRQSLPEGYKIPAKKEMASKRKHRIPCLNALSLHVHCFDPESSSAFVRRAVIAAGRLTRSSVFSLAGLLRGLETDHLPCDPLSVQPSPVLLLSFFLSYFLAPSGFAPPTLSVSSAPLDPTATCRARTSCWGRDACYRRERCTVARQAIRFFLKGMQPAAVSADSPLRLASRCKACHRPLCYARRLAVANFSDPFVCASQEPLSFHLTCYGRT